MVANVVDKALYTESEVLGFMADWINKGGKIITEDVRQLPLGPAMIFGQVGCVIGYRTKEEYLANCPPEWKYDSNQPNRFYHEWSFD